MNNNISTAHKEYLTEKKIQKYFIFFTQIFIFIFIFALWEIAANLKWIDPFLFSKPSKILDTFITMVRDGSIFLHIGITLWETILGFLFSTIIGTLISIFLWWNKFLEKVLNPYLVILNSIPKTALAPIIIVWIGNNTNAVIVTAIMTSIIVTIINVLTGFLEVDKEKIKLIHTFNGTKRQELFKVVLPASFPIIMSTIKINIGLSLVGVIVGEFLVAKSGLGYLIVYGSQIFKMDWVMLSVILLGILAAILYRAVIIIENKLKKFF